MILKWIFLLAFVTSCSAQISSRKYLKSLKKELFEAESSSIAGLTNLERQEIQEIGDANPMCHMITLKKRLQHLSDVRTNCMREIIFDDCCQPIFLGLRTSGIYPIEHGRDGYAYCDMKTDGGGWVVVARRAGGKRNFNKTWRHYKKGFGPLDRDFWVGLDAMHLLTLSETELRFDMRHKNGSWYHAYYSQISVGPESDNYTLTVGGYDPERSTIYDGFSSLDGYPFSTKDNVNVDFQSPSGCQRRLNLTGAGWWWQPGTPCYRVNLNLQYHVVYNSVGDTFPRGIAWCTVDHLKPCFIPDSSFTFIEMKIRQKQWTCHGENMPRITWATIQYKFLQRKEEEGSGLGAPII